jgi:hypothetical protein
MTLMMSTPSAKLGDQLRILVVARLRTQFGHAFLRIADHDLVALLFREEPQRWHRCSDDDERRHRLLKLAPGRARCASNLVSWRRRYSRLRVQVASLVYDSSTGSRIRSVRIVSARRRSR